jgi:hypothetical protein
LERATHIDFNRDNIIGGPPDVIYGYPTMYRQMITVPRPYTYVYSAVYQYY